ncbi:UDP-N-acetylglucosamine 4,6-dehydratase, partial [hydrothermal vent metagenome]
VVDLLNILKATAVSSAIIMIGVLFYYYTAITGTFSRTVFFIDAINTVVFIGMFRLAIRIYYNNDQGFSGLLNIIKPSRTKSGDGGGIPILIYGANERGELLLRSLTSGARPHHYDPVGFMDDDQQYWGGNIHGYPSFGGMDSFEDVITRFSVKELMVASQLAGEKLEKINTECRRLNVVCRVVPSYLDSSHVTIDASLLRGIQIEDLLDREPATIDYSKIESFLKGGRVLITGAGGSIGSQLAVHIAQFGPSRLILVEKSENYLYELGLKLKEFSSGSIRFSYNCVDITNEGQMDRLFAREKPQYLFHAAANKHVPLMETNIETAITNNIGGIKAISGLADKHGVERFILISTDKAVNPVNVMGATKKICELYVQNMASKSATSFMTVRFGNVLASNGSVAPLFLRQIENRGPVTVTDKNVKRYFMTIPEAVLLILQAAGMGG